MPLLWIIPMIDVPPVRLAEIPPDAHDDCCPACASPDIEVLGFSHRGRIVSSNWIVLPDSELRPCCCRECGLIYESRGVRLSLRDFYENAFTPTPLMRFYGDGRTKLVDLLGELATIAPTGRLLEVGSGRGQFLQRFHEMHPQWELTAIEPSVSCEALRSAVPAAEVHRCGFETYSCPPNSQDVVVALSVIQSVENPLALLMWAARALRVGGICFIEASNFELHPHSLVCGDHLSKLTARALENLAARAGFAVETIQSGGVPMYCVLRATGKLVGRPPSAFRDSLRAARQNERFVEGVLRSIADARSNARRRDEGFAIFGLASIGLTAPFILDFPPSDIVAFIDDNKHAWGSEALGRPIAGPDLIRARRIKHVALSLSPVYASEVAARLRQFDVTVYSYDGGNDR